MQKVSAFWMAHMDGYLALKDAEDITDELDLISESIDDLIEIFYRALDADNWRRGLLFASTCVCLDVKTIAYDLKFEYGRFERYKERWQGLLQQFDKDMQAALENNEQDRVTAYYQELIDVGYFVCLASFLLLFTVMPARMIMFLWQWILHWRVDM